VQSKNVAELLPGYYARTGEALAARWIVRTVNALRAVLLVGAPGTGKTFFADCLARGIDAMQFFVPCHPWLSSEEMQQGVDIGRVAVGVNNAEDAYLDGQLLRAIRATAQKKVVLVLDEVEKAGSRFYPLILDFLQNGRVPDARHKMHQADLKNLHVVLTANEEGDIPEAVKRRCFRVQMEFLPPQVETDVLRKATGAPGGACRLLVRMANAVREKGESKPSLQELKYLLEARELVSSIRETDALIAAFLVKEEKDSTALSAAVKSPGAALYGEFCRAQ
jgi:nitric oxide reductase NorQ protein